MDIDTQKPMRPFWTLWSGQAISLFGSQLVQFALIWWLTEETGSATVLAVASLMGLLPQVVLGPFIGVFVDRWSRRWVMLMADTAVAAVSILLAGLFYFGFVETWHILAILFIRSVGSSFHTSAMMATTTLMVPAKHLTQIQGVNQMLMGGMNIIAAPIGALLLAVLSIEGVLWLDALTAVCAIVPLFIITVPEPEKRGEDDADQSVWQDMKDGFLYVNDRRGILYLILMATTVNFLFAPAVAMLPLLVTDYFGGGALQFASTQSALGLGIVIGGVLLGVWGGFKSRIYTVLSSFAGLGVTFIVIGLVPPTGFLIALGAFFVSGMMSSMINGPIQAIMQVVIAPEFQGRVFSLLGSLALAVTPIGLILAGPIADLLGIRVWYVVAGAICFVVGLAGFGVSAIVHVEEGGDVPAETTKVVASGS